ncbi:MAG TPA: hypothetical protein ENK72_01920 [Epsilonproteobacteria bacterium]|nr:hypothetical protein [Campylobacterota bacterium]
MKKVLWIALWGILFPGMLSAKGTPSVEVVINASFEKVTEVKPRQLILSSAQHKQIQQQAKAPVRTKIYRYYTIHSGDRTIGHGVLITRKVRTKKATVLYAFDQQGTLKFTEIMVFREPPEYIPNQAWMNQFDNAETSALLTMGKDIPTISGATLSARTISDGARIARAIYQIVLKE